MKAPAIIASSLIANVLAGFYIFACAFNDKNFGYGNLVAVLLCVNCGLGIVSGFVLETTNWSEIIPKVVVSIIPISFFLGLLVLGSIEKGNPKQIVLAVLIFLLPFILQSSSWFLSALVRKRSSK